MPSSADAMLLKISAVLWVIWGLVHAFAGIMILASDATGGFQAIADAIDPGTFVLDYPAAVGGIM
ncbi:MAG: hypothetical protein AAGF59_12825, partial [Pseudomonadota bacterium]